MPAKHHGPESLTPKTIAILFCERVITHRANGCPSIINVLGTLNVSGFPYAANPPYCAFAVVAGMKAPAKVWFRVLRMKMIKSCSAPAWPKFRLPIPLTTPSCKLNCKD